MSTDIAHEKRRAESNVQTNFSGKPTGWSAMSKVVRDFDEEKVKECKEDIDTLLVFAGLFSAVLSAFLVAVYPALQPDRQDMILYTLDRIANQTAGYTIAGSNLTASLLVPPSPPEFHPSPNIVKVNALWFTSLILSLITASLGLLVKQWLREFLAADTPSPQARLRLRNFREPAIKAWRVYEIAPALPILLQISLGLFFLGLCYFTAHIHLGLRDTILPFIVGWAFFIVATSLFPFLFPRCPYKMTLLKAPAARVRRGKIWVKEQWWRLRCLFGLIRLIDANGLTPRMWWFLWKRIWDLPTPVQDAADESLVIKDTSRDLNIFASVDAIDANDDLLVTTMADAVYDAERHWSDIVLFIVQVLAHRIQPEATTETNFSGLRPRWPAPFRNPYRFSMMKPWTRAGILSILSRYVKGVEEKYEPMEGLDFPSHPNPSSSILYAVHVILTATGVSSDPPPQGAKSFLGYYMTHESYSSNVCNDIVNLLCSPQVDQEDSWAAMTLLLGAVTKLIPLLKLDFAVRKQWFSSVQRTVEKHLLKTSTQRALNNFETRANPQFDWDTWQMPNGKQDVPLNFKHSSIRYLICTASQEFNHVVDSPDTHSQVGSETSSVLRAALRTISQDSGSETASSTSQSRSYLVEQDIWWSFQDMVNLALRNPSSSLTLVDALSSVNLASEIYWPALFSPQHEQKQGLFPLERDTSSLVTNLTSVIQDRLGSLASTSQNSARSEPLIALKLCHITTCLLICIGYASSHRDLWRRVFESLSTSVASVIIPEKIEQARDTVSPAEASVMEQSSDTVRRLAHGCLQNIDFAIFSSAEAKDGHYDDWRVHGSGQSSAFPDLLLQQLYNLVNSNPNLSPSREDNAMYARLEQLQGSSFIPKQNERS
ncbi:hypothetical protein BDY19DRAFT_145576 [Irpex rosettiformis]|uniref:Uncharacterized protein n=1 Tax=Irpex rosettiformis TaxID=378272 RepID=A0ACB8U3J6_9APHY|nr:hypothetical protein BDY19DRAFT_145576 [Irpex rosettiformis]